MKLTNRQNLPLPVMKAVMNKTYDPGISTITVTSIISPVQKTLLEKRHQDELTEDVADRLWALRGEAIHAILERAAEGEPDYMAERRFYIEHNGFILGGQIDLYDGKHMILQDYKDTSVWSVIFGLKEEHAKQVNIGAYLLKHGFYLDDNGERVYPNIECKGLQIVAFMRDWKHQEYKRKLAEAKKKGYSTTDYPSSGVAVMGVPMIDEAEVWEYIKERIELYQKYMELSDDQLPECTDEERWAKGDSFAVMQKGKKRALRVFQSQLEANDYAETCGNPDTYVQKRPGEQTRCESYCAAASICPQYRKLKGEVDDS